MKNNYRLSFTTGGLFLRETLVLSELYQELSNWDEVRQKAADLNLLQLRTLRSAHRVTREVIARLKTLNESDLRQFSEASHDDQRLILWLTVCRLYPFVAEFASEVLHEHFITLKTDITLEDFDIFFNRKAEWNPALDVISPSTRKKLRQVLFRIMREAGLLSEHYMVIPIMLGPALHKVLSVNGNQELDYYPAYSSEIRKRAY